MASKSDPKEKNEKTGGRKKKIYSVHGARGETAVYDEGKRCNTHECIIWTTIQIGLDQTNNWAERWYRYYWSCVILKTCSSQTAEDGWWVFDDRV